MAEDTTAGTGEKAFITTLVAILLNPISVGTGYYLNELFKKPKLSIEYVSDAYTVQSDSMRPEVVASLAGILLFVEEDER